MTECQEGMMVRQEAIDWWPHIGNIVNSINEACETTNTVVLTDIFLDAANLVSKMRIDITPNGLRAELKTRLRWYRNVVRGVVNKKRLLKNPIGKYGKPLAESTLKQYRSVVKVWPKRRERLKEEIRERISEIERWSDKRGKIISRGNVSLRVIYGGQYPARVIQRFSETGWSRIR